MNDAKITITENNNTCVVIPLKNEAQGLEKLIMGILDQNPQPDEVVAVDTGSTDGTFQILQKLSKVHSQIRVISSPGALPGDARNRGISVTAAGIIVQIDGSCTITESWLKELTQPLVEGNADYVTGRILPMPEVRSILGRAVDMGNVFSASINPVLRNSDTIAGGASVAYRKKLWELAGGQPEWLRNGEDVVFVKKLIASGITPVYTDKSLAFWQVGPCISDLFMRETRYSESSLLISKRWLVENAALNKLFLMIFFLLLSFFSRLFLILFFTMIFAIIAKRTVQSIDRYYKRKHEPGSNSPVLVRLIILYTEIVLFAAQQVGLVRGIWDRISNKSKASTLEHYLQV